ncbi:hypothetical protein [Agromyces indicus]|uniref:Uncharacterized protein n=1 Tax=Agromyces indicus TaxID=758919 RepID=A0ABU1FJF7_9MICO|nr:hypothetical protein [Agromyces indicus]MDR5691864.1 hypothetical protein [Agromyces indicus]
MALKAWFRVHGDPFREAFEIEVVSRDPDEPFNAALDRAFAGHPIHHDFRVGGWVPHWLWIGGAPDDDVFLSWDQGDGLTVGQVELFLGAEGQGPPPRIALGFMGRGGGDVQRFATIVGAVAAALGGDPTPGVLAMLVEAEGAAVRRTNAENRRLYEDWRDGGGGEVSLPLEQAVRAESYWDHEAFKRRFSASDDGASEVLRRLRYEARRDHRGRRFWMDTTE